MDNRQTQEMLGFRNKYWTDVGVKLLEIKDAHIGFSKSFTTALRGGYYAWLLSCD